MRKTRRKSPQDRWNLDNLCTLGTKLRVEQACDFQELCEHHGFTVYRAIQRFCLAVLQNPDILEQYR